jgi:hypothetical protein
VYIRIRRFRMSGKSPRRPSSDTPPRSARHLPSRAYDTVLSVMHSISLELHYHISLCHRRSASIGTLGKNTVLLCRWLPCRLRCFHPYLSVRKEYIGVGREPCPRFLLPSAKSTSVRSQGVESILGSSRKESHRFDSEPSQPCVYVIIYV